MNKKEEIINLLGKDLFLLVNGKFYWKSKFTVDINKKGIVFLVEITTQRRTSFPPPQKGVFYIVPSKIKNNIFDRNDLLSPVGVQSCNKELLEAQKLL
ncbi:TPA: hypothetical protein GX533_01825 [Candidatus Dojkabacteria bacterium]|jgi:hypothetical protein|uniref:Uncharacterized protein n=1 Tax=Candidatus Dojkabacteria bacterium TaxID=2099670 RepID=A0A832QDK7_9BACT|nr:hypothetical protein [Candidatus Dojkabacteria bacterium]